MTLRHLIACLFCFPLVAAPLDHSYFGFDTNSADNYTAFRNLEAYANSNGTVSVSFSTNGTYKVTLPTPGRGLQQGACQFSNVVGATIDAPGAEFYCTNMNGAGQAIFWLLRCTNTTISANLRGDHTADGSGVKGVWLVASNDNITLNLGTRQVYDGVRIGDWNDGPPALYTGNRDITIISTNVDTRYGVAAYLADTLNINCEAEGTAAADWGLRRCVYITGSSNVTAISRSKNAAVPDGVNVVSSAPGPYEPYHFGCSNVTFYCTDLGTTNDVSDSQKLFIMAIVSSHGYTNVSVSHDAIYASLTVPETAVGFTNNYTVGIQALLSDTAQHTYNLTLAGNVAHAMDNPKATILVNTYAYTKDLKTLNLTLEGFHDEDGSWDTVWILNTNTVFNGHGYNSTYSTNGTYGGFWLMGSNQVSQLFTDHGNPYRRVNAGTIRVGSVRGP